MELPSWLVQCKVLCLLRKCKHKEFRVARSNNLPKALREQGGVSLLFHSPLLSQNLREVAVLAR